MPSTPRQAPSHPAHTLLSRAHSPNTANTLFTDRILHKPLLLQPTSAPPKSDRRALRRHIRLRKREYYLRHARPRALSAKQKRVLGCHDLKKEECQYSIYESVHRMWVGYMHEVLGLTDEKGWVSKEGQGSFLASAEYMGARMTVVRSNCTSYVGLSGIVVRDTKFTFVLVTTEDEAKTVPKKGSVFRFEVPLAVDQMARDEGAETAGSPEERKPLVFELHGNQFEFRPADRAKKQFKWQPMDYV